MMVVIAFEMFPKRRTMTMTMICISVSNVKGNMASFDEEGPFSSGHPMWIDICRGRRRLVP